MISLRLQATTSVVRVGLSGPSCRSDPCVVSSGTRFTMPQSTQTLDATWMAAVQVVKNVSEHWKRGSSYSTCLQRVSRNTCGGDRGPHKAKEAVKNLCQSITPSTAHSAQGSVQMQAETSPTPTSRTAAVWKILSGSCTA